ncbi:unnamed protein product [Adineta ricciae]|uniref:Uncharacterized protein n=2 Tax=Adineta ricciae TaxID=249248 RepID=A0A814AZ16_ADIRI|nr:unnamed protein product [Adineta ricciae]
MIGDYEERKPLLQDTDSLGINNNDRLLNERRTTSFMNMSNEKCEIHRNSSQLEASQSSWTRWTHVIFWWWLNPLLRLGHKQILTDDDLEDLPRQEKCLPSFQKLLMYDWSTTTTTWRIVLSAFRNETFFVGLILVPFLIVRLLQPLFLRDIIQQINSMESTSLDLKSISISVFGLILCTIIHAMVFQQFFFRSALLGRRIRHALSSIIYQHVLAIQTSAIQQTTSAQIINLLSDDISKFDELWTDGHFLWVGPLETLFTFLILWWIVGLVPTICSVITVLLLIPIQFVLSRLFAHYRAVKMTHADKRLQVFSEILHGCQLIKIYNWEKPMEKRVADMRQHELATIKRANHLRAINECLFFSSPCLFSCVTFLSLWFLGYHLNAADVFVTLNYFIQLRFSLFRLLPLNIQQLSSVSVASKRIDSFMKLEKVQPQNSMLNVSIYKSENDIIVLRNASFSWGNDQTDLSSLNIHIESGQLVGIMGSVGAGKSSLFAALLGEMKQISGQMQVNGSVSYAAQSPWIFADTIRANILLGKEMNEKRYTSVIRACCLDIDFKALGNAGDLTVVGERGVNLSGGQKARVSLARAIYVDADIYLFDDPLSAVDPKVAEQIFNACISSQGLLSEKTRLLITHQRRFIAASDISVLLEGGHIEAQGPFQELSVRYYPTSEIKDDIQRSTHRDNVQEISIDELDFKKAVADSQSIIHNETSLSGHANWKIRYRLFTETSLGYFGFYILIFLLVVGEFLYNISNYWLVEWTNKTYITQQTVTYFAYIYVILVLGIVVMSYVRADYWFYVLLNGSASLHNRMLKGILYSSMRFFESNPSGRILNRASQDQRTIEEILPAIFFDAVQVFMTVLGSVIVIVLINPLVSIVVIPLIVATWYLRNFHIVSGRQLRRLESVTRSPVYAFFSSSLDGLTTIRAFKVQEDFKKTFFELIDANTRAYVPMLASNHWLGFHLDLIVILFQMATIIIGVMTCNANTSAALALALAYSITLSQRLARCMQQLAETEIHMTSVERIDEYAQISPEEDDGGNQETLEIESNWPSLGEIEFRNYTMRYRPELEPVLCNINLHISPMEKIGIIGRTGAGKSSLFQALFRLVERAAVNGEIFIDGIAISRLKRSHLRSHLSAIPQTPVLFSGTLRYNLDPFDIYTDEECFNALKDVQLNHFIGLDMPVTEYGKNFSVGECQLICVARALLKHSKILLIDEATANIDHETDALIQKVIADKFRDRTILTIAHRLNTVAESDRILVMDQGRIAQFDVPNKIL